MRYNALFFLFKCRHKVYHLVPYIIDYQVIKLFFLMLKYARNKSATDAPQSFRTLPHYVYHLQHYSYHLAALCVSLAALCVSLATLFVSLTALFVSLSLTNN